MEQAVGIPLQVEQPTTGLHLIGDLHDCGAGERFFHDAATLRTHCLALVKAAGLTAVGECFHQFGEGGGVTGVVMLAESHLSFHTWPERRYVAVDVYVCNYTTDNRAKARQLFDGLLETFRPGDPRLHEVERDREDAPEPGRYLVERLNDDSGYYLRVRRAIEQGATRYQQMEVLDTPMFGRVLRLDGVFQTSEKEEFFYHENIVHVAAITHPAPRSALIIGGGDGGAAEELLKHGSIERVVLAELDEGVVETARRHLGAIHRGAFDDPRLEVRITDGRVYVEETANRYDLVVLDLTDPSGPSQALYTREFYTACRKVLNPGGLLALHVESPISRPQVYNRIIKTLQAAFPLVRPYLVYIPLYGTWWGMAVASEGADPLAITEEQVDRRIAERGLSRLQFYNGAMHRAVFALPNFVRDLLAEPAEVIMVDGSPLEEKAALNPARQLVLAER